MWDDRLMRRSLAYGLRGGLVFTAVAIGSGLWVPGQAPPWRTVLAWFVLLSAVFTGLAAILPYRLGILRFDAPPRCGSRPPASRDS